MNGVLSKPYRLTRILTRILSHNSSFHVPSSKIFSLFWTVHSVCASLLSVIWRKLNGVGFVSWWHTWSGSSGYGFFTGTGVSMPRCRWGNPEKPWWHDDVIKWKHFLRYWSFVWGIHRSPVNFPHKSQWRGALMFSLICTRRNGWVNNGEAGDLGRRRAHYDVIVMIWTELTGTKPEQNVTQLELYA